MYREAATRRRNYDDRDLQPITLRGRERARRRRPARYGTQGYPPPPPPPRRIRSRSRSIDYVDRPLYLVQGLEQPEEDEDDCDDESRRTFVRYHAKFSADGYGVLHQVSSKKPLPTPKQTTRESESVFDVVVEYATQWNGRIPRESRYVDYGRRRTSRGSDDSSRSRSARRSGQEGPPKFSIVSLQGWRTIEIKSPAIILALQYVVKYFPGGPSLVEETISISEPYMLLVYHQKELREYREARNPAKAVDICEKEKDAYLHLGILQDYLNDSIMPSIDAERVRHTRGLATWDMLWLLFRPGSDVAVVVKDPVSNFKPFLRGYIVEEVTGGPCSKGNRSWEVRLAAINFDGTVVGKIVRSQYIDHFEGETEISKLDIKPAHWPGNQQDGLSIVERLKRDGRAAWDLFEPKCLQHSGKATEFPYNDVDGLVMVDEKTYFVDNADDRPILETSAPHGGAVSLPECYCDVCTKRKADKQAQQTEPESEPEPEVINPFEGLESLSKGGQLTDHQAFLYPSRVYAFHFRSRMWELIEVSNLGPPVFKQDILDTLVMGEERIKMLKALSKKYMRVTENGSVSELRKGFWSADFIGGKGKSQIILLHGRPGVGKTYTAECIAEHTKRPLMTLTCADIGTDPEEVEQNLEYHFTAARDWGALVLIDEADIYMEKRSSNDLTRNSLVAGFLRALEVYEGMLFLTTNRVGAFDDAFVSRIHVKLYYPDLTDTDRQRIWKSFIEKLARERRRDIRVTADAKDYIRGKKVRELDLNGREIRNAFQTAVALAEYDDIRDEEGTVLIEESHIQQVAEMSEDFKRYLTGLHQGDEKKRAMRGREWQ